VVCPIHGDIGNFGDVSAEAFTRGRPSLESARALDRVLKKLSASSYTDTQARYCSAVPSHEERDVPAIISDPDKSHPAQA
jgi:hypothetical protein